MHRITARTGQGGIYTEANLTLQQCKTMQADLFKDGATMVKIEAM